jgi:hypothetical protein
MLYYSQASKNPPSSYAPINGGPGTSFRLNNDATKKKKNFLLSRSLVQLFFVLCCRVLQLQTSSAAAANSLSFSQCTKETHLWAFTRLLNITRGMALNRESLLRLRERRLNVNIFGCCVATQQCVPGTQGYKVDRQTMGKCYPSSCCH